MTVATDQPVDDRYLTSGGEAGTAPGDRRFRPDVQGLRAVAVLLVVLYHAGWQPVGGGYVGVDVFFVISGFVITGVLLRERSSSDRTSIVAFYGRRCRRIIPAATLVILATVTLAYLVLGVVYGGQTAIDGRWAAVFLANYHFASEGTNYLSSQQPPSLLQNFWSLAVEEQFYLVYPAFFVLVATIPSKLSLRARLAIGLSGIIVISYLVSVIQTGSSPTVAFFSPLTRAWELALGALVAVSTEWLLRIPARVGSALTWVGLGAIGVAAFTFTAATSYPGWLAVVPVAGTALVIAGGSAVPRHGAETLLRLPPLQWLGMLSYSIYLWHWPILILAADHAGQASLPFRQNVVWLAVALAASVATYYLVENPLRRGKLPVSSRWAPVALGVVLVLVSVGVVTLQLQAHTDAGGATPAPTTTVGPPPGPAPASGYVAAVETAVRAASRIRSLPANLSPPLAQASSDWGGPSGPCFPAFGVSTVPSCVFGDPHGTQTVVLYGDSHAAMWTDVISSIAQIAQVKLVVLTKGYCPADMLSYGNPTGWGSPRGEFAPCDRFHRFAIQRIRQLDPALVIISQEVRGSASNTAYSPQQWNHGLQDAMHQLGVPSNRIVILGNIPVLPESGPQCLSRNTQDIQNCSGPVDPLEQRYIRAEATAASQFGASYINLTPWFCSTTCTAVIGKNVVYLDQYHVTLAYSYFLEGALAESLHPAPST